MRLLDEGVPTVHSFNVNLNGSGGYSDYDTSESESEIEEPEPVSATLVLRVVNEPSYTNDLNETSSEVGQNSLMVQVQRPISRKSASEASQRQYSSAVSKSSKNDAELNDERQLRISMSGQNSGDTSREISPDLLGPKQVDLVRYERESSVDFMKRISEQSKEIQEGMKELRGEIDNPINVLDIGQEAIILSGLKQSTAQSLQHVKELYEDTKALKSYLEKLEAKTKHEIELQKRQTEGRYWFKWPLVAGLITFVGLLGWRMHDPLLFETHSASLGAAANSAMNYFSSKGQKLPKT